MWTQVYAPIGGSLGLSAPAAAIPIVVLFIMLGALRTQAWVAAATALLSAFIVAIVIYRMPLNLAVISTLYGGAYGLFPIAWIVFASIMLYRLAVDTGKFEVIKDSVGGLTDDRRARLPALLRRRDLPACQHGAGRVRVDRNPHHDACERHRPSGDGIERY